jgi:hypothetical protein
LGSVFFWQFHGFCLVHISLVFSVLDMGETRHDTTRVFPRRSRFCLIYRLSITLLYSGQTMNGNEPMSPWQAFFSLDFYGSGPIGPTGPLGSFFLSRFSSLPPYLDAIWKQATSEIPPLLRNIRNGCRGPRVSFSPGHVGHRPRQAALAGQEAGSEGARFGQGVVVFGSLCCGR